MIDTHHLAYVGVILVFLTGAAVVAPAAFLFLSTGDGCPPGHTSGGKRWNR